MHRDLDLVRAILMFLDSAEIARVGGEDVRVQGYDRVLIREHLRLMGEAGLIGGVANTLGDGTTRYSSIHITWAGYEFLEAARNPTVWERGVTVVKEKAGAMPFEVLKAVLIKLATGLVGG